MESKHEAHPPEPESQAHPECPGCGVRLPASPPKIRKCRSCGIALYTRRRPNESQPRVVTKEEAEAIDREWAMHNRVPSPEFTPVLLAEIETLEREQDFDSLCVAYIQVAQCYAWHDADKVLEFLRRAQENQLLVMKRNETPRVSVLAAHDCCADCQALEGKLMTVADAQDRNLIPCKRCIDETGWCSAGYVPEPEP